MGYKIQKIYIGQTQVRPSGWKPGANTVLYLPLNGDVVDYSSYNRSFTVYGNTGSVGTPEFDTLSNGKKVAKFIASDGDNSNRFAFSDNVTDIPSSGDMTLSFWMNWSGTTNYYESMVVFRSNEGTDKYCWMSLLFDNTDAFTFHGTSAYTTSFVPTIGHWYHMVCVVDGGTYYIYKDGDGTPIKTGSFSYGTASPKICIGAFYFQPETQKRDEPYNGKLSEVILENKARTSQEVSDYYNLTKGNYGIS